MMFNLHNDGYFLTAIYQNLLCLIIVKCIYNQWFNTTLGGYVIFPIKMY
jgi:hypothetical protein